VLVAVYVPNSGDGLVRLDYRVNEWDKDFHQYLCKLKEVRKKPIILAGDLNVAHHEIDLYDPVRMDGCACFTEEERNSF
jgi:exonuclease III